MSRISKDEKLILYKILEAYYDDEKKDFEEEYSTEIINTDEIDDLEKQLRWIEEEAQGTEHVFYSLLILKMLILAS